MRRYLRHLVILIILVLSVTPADFASADHTDSNFWFAPPTAGAGNNAYLEQSWHENNKGLDWTAGGNYTTYLRGWGASSDSSSTVRAYVVLDDSYQLSGCKSVWADVYDLGDNWLDSVGYVHTEDMQFTGSHNLVFSSSWQCSPLRGRLWKITQKLPGGSGYVSRVFSQVWRRVVSTPDFPPFPLRAR